MSERHSVPIRGLTSVSRSPNFQGSFGRMFRALPTASFGKKEQENIDNLGKLGAVMSADFDPPRDGKDDEESGIPALYTYLAQFIDHDITFDPASSLQKQNDPDALTDFRNPALDLDNVYGRGPGDQPYLYKDGRTFLLGDKINVGDSNARDLPRNKPEDPKAARALIGDPRNDENAIVSQLQGLFLRFHNRMADELTKTSPSISFESIQREVRFHYQYMVIHDFLPRIVHSSVIRDLKTGHHYDRAKLRFFHWRHDPFMPVEFSVAAYRLGHSMIRPGYRLNDADATLLPIFPVESQGLNEGLTGFRPMNPAWGIDWGRFVDIDVRGYDGTDAVKKKRLQFAYRLDTSLVNPLSDLPEAVVPKSDPPPSLAQRNLLRGWRLGLPSGQDVARAMGVRPLRDSEILIGKAVDVPDAPLQDIVSATGLNVFANNCPLWTYILVEAMHHKEPVKIPVKEDVTIHTPKLGHVGGRIVAEVFLGLLFGDPSSHLNLDPLWVPKMGTHFGLKDFVQYALGQ